MTKFNCAICGARLVGLILANGKIEINPLAKKPSRHYPLCSRCWRQETSEGREYNSSVAIKSQRKINPEVKRLRLKPLVALAKERNLSLTKKRDENCNWYELRNGLELILRVSTLTEVKNFLDKS